MNTDILENESPIQDTYEFSSLLPVCVTVMLSNRNLFALLVPLCRMGRKGKASDR